jgi:hypothetical protein
MITQIQASSNTYSSHATLTNQYHFSNYIQANYVDSGYSIPMNLLMPAWHIKEMLLKRNKRGLRRVFEQIAYLCLATERRVCYMKQATLGKGCGNFDGKELSRKQVGRLERTLVELGLYKRDKFRSDESFDRMLSPLGTVTYLLLKNLVKFKPSEKMSQPKRKNVPAQFLRQKENFYLNTTEPDSTNSDKKSQTRGLISQKIEKKIGISITDIDKTHRFDLPSYQEHRKISNHANKEMELMRKMLRGVLAQ